MERTLRWLASAVAALLVALAMLVAMSGQALPATKVLRWTNPSYRAASSGGYVLCGAGPVPLTDMDSVRVVAYPRYKEWWRWPAWRPRPRVVLLARAVSASMAGRPDSAVVQVPQSQDSTYSVCVQAHRRGGWSCESRLALVTAESR